MQVLRSKFQFLIEKADILRELAIKWENLIMKNWSLDESILQSNTDRYCDGQ